MNPAKPAALAFLLSMILLAGPAWGESAQGLEYGMQGKFAEAKKAFEEKLPKSLGLTPKGQ